MANLAESWPVVVVLLAALCVTSPSRYIEAALWICPEKFAVPET